MKNLFERVSHIVCFGKDYDYYKLYFKKDTYFDKDEQAVILNEKEFYTLDKLYNGELANLVLN